MPREFATPEELLLAYSKGRNDLDAAHKDLGDAVARIGALECQVIDLVTREGPVRLGNTTFELHGKLNVRVMTAKPAGALCWPAEPKPEADDRLDGLDRAMRAEPMAFGGAIHGRGTV